MEDNTKDKKAALTFSVADEVKVLDGANLELSPKGKEVEGDVLGKEVARLRENIQLETRVMFIGFMVVVVAVGLFIAQAFYQSSAFYNALQANVSTLQAEVHILSSGKF